MSSLNIQQKPNHKSNETWNKENSIEEYFSGSTILLTGATGFLGKGLLEKLLRSFRSLSAIFIMIRPKGNQTIEERHKQLLASPIFDLVREKDPLFMNKVHPISSDVSLPELGMSEEDRKMLCEKVNIVIHSAATVRFNESLKVAINMNLKGTQRVLELCRCMKNLINIVYVSTAYSNVDHHTIQEKIYTPKLNPSTVIDISDNLDDKTIAAIEKKLLGKFPNTYVFSKNLTEYCISQKYKDMPITIVRPSIIGASEKEPFPGWVDSFSGMTGIVSLVGSGIQKILLANKNCLVNLIPLEYAVDTIICASWQNRLENNKDLIIYNCTTNSAPLTWQQLIEHIKKSCIKVPSKNIMSIPSCMFTTNFMVYNTLNFLFATLPAFVIDSFLKVLGYKAILTQLAKRALLIVQVGNFFLLNDWIFQMENMKKLKQQVQMTKEYENFTVDIKNLNWESYICNYWMGINKFMQKENIESTKAAMQKRLLIIYCIHRCIQASSIFLLLTIILRFVC